ncbi:hypothetical protein [Caballeronia sp. ATUFL_M2_KS44]|uniref:hypothetical protein n=1 Tax=Caballeronia sp. ATUFL_M2_KS44 TaxID=2921767 RepID=UPI002028BFE3|nr:hypothetical protein [Caballeronia sp. ATUFL_M2_KS44]
MSTSEYRREALFHQVTREAIELGSLVSIREMGERLNVPCAIVYRMLDEGDLFAFEDDDDQFIPTLLAPEPSLRPRLWSICKILYPAPASSRLAFLIGNSDACRSDAMVDLLATDAGYEYVRRCATQWAAEWSRSEVSIFNGACQHFPRTEPLYQAVVEVDPRVPAWTRALMAMSDGEERGREEQPAAKMTLFLCTIAPPNVRTIEHRLNLTIADQGASLAVQVDDDKSYFLPLPTAFDIRRAASVAWHVTYHMERGGRDAGLSHEDAAQILSVETNSVLELVRAHSLAQVASWHCGNGAITLTSLRDYQVAAYARTRNEAARLSHMI